MNSIAARIRKVEAIRSMLTTLSASPESAMVSGKHLQDIGESFACRKLL